VRHAPGAPLAVASAINDYLKPFVIGKNPDEIEDIWQSAYVSSYFRQGDNSPLLPHMPFPFSIIIDGEWFSSKGEHYA
jgi:hypothetical protein